jgi:hypothetical protein
MKNVLLTIVVAALAAYGAQAKVWRVNFSGQGAKFTNLQRANDSTAVLAGDTLHLEGSAATYPAAILNKRLVIIGNGYFQNQNSIALQNANSSMVFQLTFSQGSENSLMMGVTVVSNTFIRASNITLMRNRLGIVDANTSSVNVGINNLLMTQNYCEGELSLVGSPTKPISAVVTNNIFRTTNLYSVRLLGATQGTFANNVVRAPNNQDMVETQSTTGAWLLQNNIFIYPVGPAGTSGLGTVNTTYRNNLFVTFATPASLPAGNGNVIASTGTGIFVTTGSTDGLYQLTTGSPAIGAGFGGVNMGAFGGATPYVLSGIPSIPTIQVLSAPTQSTGNTLPVTITTTVNN